MGKLDDFITIEEVEIVYGQNEEVKDEDKVCVDKVYLLNIKNINDDFARYIDKYIYEICEGESPLDEDELIMIKEQILDRIDKPTDKTKGKHTRGAIAEFFVILFMKHLNFKQGFLFFNLEERSFKKGFDGVYTLEDELYFLESKSSLVGPKSSHSNSLNKAKNGLIDSMTFKNKRENWTNAYHHALITKSSESVITELRRLKKEYYKNKRMSKVYNVKELDKYNVIPVSTLFYEDSSLGFTAKMEIQEVIKKQFKGFKAKSLHIICLNKESTKHFINYLKR